MAAVIRTGLLVLLAVTCASFLAGLLVPRWTRRPEPGVTLRNFLRIRDDMTGDEVAALLGREPDGCIGGSGICCCSWQANGREAHVTFEYLTGDGQTITSRTFRRPGVPDVTIPPPAARWSWFPLWCR